MRRLNNKWINGLILLSLLFSFTWAPVANAQAGIAAGRLSVAISEITIAKAARWGFAANDPRVTATRAGISGGLTVLAVGAGLVSWPALLVGAGIAAVVAGGVALASGGDFKWTFDSSGITAGGKIAGAYPTASVSGATTNNGSGPIVAGSGVVYYASVSVYYQGDVKEYPIASSNAEILAGMVLSNAYGNGVSVVGCFRTAQRMDCEGRLPNGNGVQVPLYVSTTGYAVASSGGTYDGRPPVNGTMISPVVFAKADEAIKAIPAALLDKPLSPELMAAAVNTAWKAATPASQTGGIPWSASDPVTPADVADYYAKYPGTIPSVANWASAGTASVSGQVTVPIGSTYSLGGGSSGTMPSSGGGGTVTQPGGGTAPVTEPTPTAPTTPSDPNAIKLDLGPIPNIGAPVLEDTPTTAKILDPIFGMMPDLKAFTVPSHTSACPAASFSVYGQNYVVNSHCNLLEANRALIASLMLVIYTLAATFTVLRA